MRKRAITLAAFTETLLDLDKARKLAARADKGRPKQQCGNHDHYAAMRFRDLYRAAYPDQAGLDVLIDRTGIRPLIESGRIAELLELQAERRDPDAGGRLLGALERSGTWVHLGDVIGMDKQLAAELWLAEQDVAVQASTARYQLPFWIALSLARGEKTIRGGVSSTELRLDPATRQLHLFAA